MKKAFICCFAVIVVLAFTGCNSETNPDVVSVSQAKNLRDGTYVQMTGSIIGSLANEWYTFQDSSGIIQVEIESEVWVRAGINRTNLTFPNSFRYEIIGEVDKDRGQDTVIDVSSIKQL